MHHHDDRCEKLKNHAGIQHEVFDFVEKALYR